nr:aldolase vrtj [Quercus suber]
MSADRDYGDLSKDDTASAEPSSQTKQGSDGATYLSYRYRYPTTATFAYPPNNRCNVRYSSKVKAGSYSTRRYLNAPYCLHGSLPSKGMTGAVRLLQRSNRLLLTVPSRPYSVLRTSPRQFTQNMATAALQQQEVREEAQHLTNGSTKVNHWSQPGPAAFDFRSDVVTTPTSRMLSAIASTTLLDDVFQSDPTTTEFEALVADLTGKPAALLVLSGTMGNQVALRTQLLAPPHSIVTDHRSHILEWEAGGVAVLTGALVKPVTPSNGTYVTLEDVQKHTVISDDIHSCPTRLISLENTLGGMVQPLHECQRIAAWAREHGILMHLDGARLWEAVAAGAGSLKDFCACFDSISLCFSKGLGAPIGSVIVGSQAFRERARWIRKSLGGGLRQAGVVTAPMRVALEDTYLGGRLVASHERARQIAKLWESYGGRTANPVETNMVWLDLEAAGVSMQEFIALGEKAGLRLMGGRLVVHYQICDEAVARLEKVMQHLFKGEELQGDVQHAPEKLKMTTE